MKIQPAPKVNGGPISDHRPPGLLQHALVSLIATIVLAVPPGVRAQVRPADAEAIRESKAKATATFLDSKRPKEERLAAAKDLRYPDEKTFAALLAIGLDRSQDDAIRLEALKHHRYDDKYLDAVLNILRDPDDGGEELDANLVYDLNRRTTFTPPAEIRQRIQEVLRKLLEDTRAEVRLSAYRALVANHDAVAVNLLAESLRTKKDVPVPLPEAIDLLDLDGSINHIAALRPYLNHEDQAVQARAARALAVDAESRAKIIQLAKEPKTPLDVRLQALRALAREDERFAEYALPIVEDAEGDPRVRQAAMQDFAGRMNYNKVEPRIQVRFAEAVEKIAANKVLRTEDARKLQASAEQLHAYLRKAFPEIQKHYETPR
ncbi:MAG TPA: hypothetical protein VNP98_18100 [Chthoniobacterales bacterium]|nr:hypothetical protein [Chthoniobacterales bacterium]